MAGGAAGVLPVSLNCPLPLRRNHQFSASAVELEFLRSERRLRSGKHFAQSAVYSRFRHSFYALLLLGLFSFWS